MKWKEHEGNITPGEVDGGRKSRTYRCFLLSLLHLRDLVWPSQAAEESVEKTTHVENLPDEEKGEPGCIDGDLGGKKEEVKYARHASLEGESCYAWWVIKARTGVTVVYGMMREYSETVVRRKKGKRGLSGI
jgi:hypothetical protein